MARNESHAAWVEEIKKAVHAKFQAAALIFSEDDATIHIDGESVDHAFRRLYEMTITDAKCDYLDSVVDLIDHSILGFSLPKHPGKLILLLSSYPGNNEIREEIVS